MTVLQRSQILYLNPRILLLRSFEKKVVYIWLGLLENNYFLISPDTFKVTCQGFPKLHPKRFARSSFTYSDPYPNPEMYKV